MPRFTMPRADAFDTSGNPRAGAKLYFYTTGTTTPLTTYSDDGLTTPNTNPVVADSAGLFGDIFLGTGTYKVVLKSAADVTIWTADPVTAGAASAVVYLTTGGTNRTVQSKLSDLVSVKDYGAVGDAATACLIPFQTAVDSGAKRILVPAGTYAINGTVTLPSGVTLEGDGDGSVLVNARVVVAGSVGAEAGLTVAAERGDTTLSLSTTGFAVGDWVYIKSCINALSVDAGADQLGIPTGSFLGAYFSEFAKVNALTPTVMTIAGATIFPYAITAGAFSGARTNSGIAKVTFAEGGGVKRLKFISNDTSVAYVIKATWARNFVIEDILITLGSSYIPAIQPENCLGVRIARCRVLCDPFGVGSATPARNSLRVVASQDVLIDGCEVDGGYQGADITWTDLSGVSAGCVIQGCTFRNALEGATTHSGVYGGSISNNTVIDCLGGIRVRSTQTRVIGNTIDGKLSGIGINATSGFSAGTIISGNIITGQLYGIAIDHESDIATADASLYPGRCVVSGNTIKNASTGILVYGIVAGATTRLTPCLIKGNVLDACRSRGIFVGSYTNGVVVDGNLVTGPFAVGARAGIEWGANAQYLTITNNVIHYLGASIYGLRGPSTTAFMTDLVTFPLGDAEAFLTLRDNLTLGLASAFETTGILRNAAAYVSTTQTIGTHQSEGRAIIRQITAVTGNLQEWQASAGTVVLGVDQAGKLTGSIATTAKAAIAAAADVAALKTALAGLFA
jgi:hypothetical protein